MRSYPSVLPNSGVGASLLSWTPGLENQGILTGKTALVRMLATFNVSCALRTISQGKILERTNE